MPLRSSQPAEWPAIAQKSPKWLLSVSTLHTLVLKAKPTAAIRALRASEVEKDAAPAGTKSGTASGSRWAVVSQGNAGITTGCSREIANQVLMQKIYGL
jgi:hypothetical protein